MNGYPVGYFFRVRHKNDSDKWAFLSTPIYDENVVAAQARLALTYTPDKFVLTPDGTTLTSGVTVERALAQAAAETRRKALIDARYHGHCVKTVLRHLTLDKPRFTVEDVYLEARWAARAAFLANPNLKESK